MIPASVTVMGPFPGELQPVVVPILIPFSDGEDFPAALERVAAAVRDALRIPPAPPTDERTWRVMVARVKAGAK